MTRYSLQIITKICKTYCFFNSYCTKWKPTVNCKKTKVLIFNGKKKDYKNVLQKYWCPLIRFGLLNYILPIETGRWKNVTIQNRICPLCNNVDIGDEFHYIFTCPFFKNERNRFLPSSCQSKPNIYKLLKLFNSKTPVFLEGFQYFVV